MSIQRIEQPLHGERVVALSPEDASLAATDWLRRPNLFAGRALTAPTLQGRQRWQAGHIAQRGQALTPGVVRGLEVSWTPPAVGRPRDEARLLIEAGQGLSVSGEDVMLVRRLECWLSDLPVAAPPAWFEALPGDAPVTGESAVAGSLHVRKVHPSLRLADVRESAGARMSRVGVLVLQPATVDNAAFDPNDPCDLCPCGEGESSESNVSSFQDWRITDGTRLLWYPWPQEWKPLPATQLRLRNALAHSVFDAEAALAHGEALPWEAWGVPIALVGLDEHGAPLWIDRAAVVRQGGRAREARLQLAAGTGLRMAGNSRLPALWQARMEQFAEQMAESGDPLPPPQILADPYLKLPPCGLMPRSALDLSNFRSPFFPPIFELDAVPVPIEQLDLAMRESAPLACFDMSSPERLRLLVPVTQASWEPRLLFKEVVDPEFQQALDEFLLRRARELGARQGLQMENALLLRALTGREQPVPDYRDDPAAVEPESLTPWGPPPAGGGHVTALRAGLHQHYFDGAGETFTASAGESLFVWVCLDPDQPPRTIMLQWRDAAGWEHRAYWGEDLVPWGRPELGVHPFKVPAHHHVGALPQAGRWLRLEVPSPLVGAGGVVLNGAAFTLFDGRCAFGTMGARSGNSERKWFCNVLPAGARNDGDEAWELLTHNDLWAPFQPGEGVVPAIPAEVPAGGGHVEASRAGVHQHFLEGATTTLGAIAATDNLFVWVYLDPNDPPHEVMIQWKVGPNWEADGRRAYWGLNLIGWGANDTVFRRRAGGLPAVGQWVRLEVPATAVDLVGRAVNGIAFTLYNGCAAFGACGKIVQAAASTSGSRAEVVWFAGGPPAGALLRETWNWIAARDLYAPTPASRVGQVAELARLMADPALASLSDQERAQLPLRGLEGFMAYLSARADRADDITDFGFAHMQVDMHRVRQMMMSTVDASRLAISPTLAAIAKSDSALNVQSQIKDFLGGIKTAARAAPTAAPAPRAVAMQANFSAALTSVQSIKQASHTALIQSPRAPLDIVYANPVVGLAELRTTAIAERLKQPASTETRDYALANRHRAVQDLLALLNEFLAEDGGEVPALFRGFEVFGLTGDPFLATGATRRPLADFRDGKVAVTQLLRPPPLPAEDDAGLFTQSVALSDNTIAMLRQIESRLTVYRQVLARCETALATLRGHLQTSARQLQAAGEALAEARHDVGVARALLAEEQARIEAINARRKAVLDEEVQYLAFVRPRETRNNTAAPRRVLDPGLLEAPVPACLREHDDVPDELDEMLKVLREAPVTFFVGAPRILQKIDRPELLLRTLKSAQLRSSLITQRALPAVSAGTGQLGVHISQMLVRQTQAVALRAESVLRLDLQRLGSATWQGVQREAQEVISLGDIIDGDHGKGEVARLASQLFERIAGVCACLHAEFSGVVPAIRLEWAEVMSQFDATPNLRNLGGLPRWSAIGYVDRRQMQAYTDFLFDQVDPGNNSAVALINDVVRMALLLASHAPVGRIIAGRMPRAVTAVRVGSRIPLTAQDNSRLRVGMQAMIYKGTTLMARATVEDVGLGEVSARLVHTSSVQIDLDTDVRVHFDQAKVLSASPARSGGIFKR